MLLEPAEPWSGGSFCSRHFTGEALRAYADLMRRLMDAESITGAGETVALLRSLRT